MDSNTFLKLIRVLIFRKEKGGNTWPFKTKFPNFLFNLVLRYILVHRPLAPASRITPSWVKHAHVYLCFSCHTVSFAFTALSPLYLSRSPPSQSLSWPYTLEQFIPSSDPIPFSNCSCTSLCHSFCNSIVLTYLTFFIIYPFTLCILSPTLGSALGFVDLIYIKR